MKFIKLLLTSVDFDSSPLCLAQNECVTPELLSIITRHLQGFFILQFILKREWMLGYKTCPFSYVENP